MKDSESEDRKKASRRWRLNKGWEKIHRKHVRQALILLQRFHNDLRFWFLPDRPQEVDLIIKTKLITHRAELKGLNKDWAFWHGDPEDSKSYEYNFPSRGATMNIITEHVLLPLHCSWGANVVTPSPRELAKIPMGNKSHSLVLRTVLELESVLYFGERVLLRYLRRSCMHESWGLGNPDTKVDPLCQLYSTLLQMERDTPILPYTTSQQLSACGP